MHCKKRFLVFTFYGGTMEMLLMEHEIRLRFYATVASYNGLQYKHKL